MKNKIIFYALLIGLIIEFIINHHYIDTFRYGDYYSFCASAYLFLSLTYVGLFSVRKSPQLIALFFLSLFTCVMNYIMIDAEMYYVFFEFRWGGYFNWANFYRLIEVVIFCKVVLDGIMANPDDNTGSSASRSGVRHDDNLNCGAL